MQTIARFSSLTRSAGGRKQKPWFVRCRRKHSAATLALRNQLRKAPLNHRNYLLGLQITQSRSKHQQVPPCRGSGSVSAAVFEHPPSPGPHKPLTFGSPAAEERGLCLISSSWDIAPLPSLAPLDWICSAPCKQSHSSCLRGFLARCLGDIAPISYTTFKYTAGKGLMRHGMP